MTLKLISGSFYIPKDNKKKPQGEDAHFTCDARNTMGVADGVGGWAWRGIDSGEYARLLMENSCVAVFEEPEGDIDPKRVLSRAYETTSAQGSSTACIVTLQGNDLAAGNVGDSGFMIFRDKKEFYRSPIKQHKFNAPYQLGRSSKCDKPDVAVKIRVPVKAGDIIILGTDGLLDNMYPSEIKEILVQSEDCGSPEQLAYTIAQKAMFNSYDKSYRSPFESAACSARRPHIGGKVDDITVVVGLLIEARDS